MGISWNGLKGLVGVASIGASCSVSCSTPGRRSGFSGETPPPRKKAASEARGF
jgi:hypothetical protein